MDSRYAGALKAFISHNPSEQPIDPGAADPLRDRPGDSSAASAATRPLRPQGSGPDGVDPSALLPLIFAQLPLKRSYRLRPRHMSPMRPRQMGR